MRQICTLFFVALCLVACHKDAPQAPDPAYNTDRDHLEYTDVIAPVLSVPEQPFAYFSGNFVGTNRSADWRATLGRVIFYDKSLSKDGTISCASCHQQDKGFADPAAFSKGIYGRTTHRNSFALAAFSAEDDNNTDPYFDPNSGGNFQVIGGLFWDGRASTLANQSRETFANEREMGMSMHDVTARIRENNYYAWFFRQAFNTSEVTDAEVFDCINSFLAAMNINPKSPYDLAKANLPANVDFPAFTARQNLGKQLFLQNCNDCHQTLSNGTTIAVKTNNGLDMEYADQGIFETSQMEKDKGVFRVPHLRNIERSAPYMHDGRFQSLEQVVNHYSDNLQAHPNLDARLSTFDHVLNKKVAKNMNFTTDEKVALIDFLKTFTDQTLATDRRFSDPF